MTLDMVKQIIQNHRNEKRIAFDEKLSPNQTGFNGLTIPKLREISKLIYKDNPYEFLDQNDFSNYELEQLQAMVIGLIKDMDVALKYMNSFIPYVKRWSVNDTLCMDFKIAKTDLNKLFLFLKPYFNSTKEFEQRIVAVMFLCHFLTDDYIDIIIPILDQLKIQEYYAKMAVAWAFATILAKYPDKGLAYIKNNHLDKWTHNKAIQKAIESYRVNEDLKEILKTLKRK